MHELLSIIMRTHSRFLVQLALALLPIGLAQALQAQLSLGEAFMQGQFVEVGINQCGVFGGNGGPLTTLGPGPIGPWHPNVGSNLGFVADADQDGWTVGTPVHCGDYFVPGSPEESWALQVGSGTVYRNAQLGCTTNDIPGSITAYNDYGTSREVIWEGTLVSAGLNLSIKQTTVLPEDKLYFVTFVEVTNNAPTSVLDLYYGRSVDPDNEQPLPGGSFSTTNTVLRQPPVDMDALVSADGLLYGCFLGLGARDTDARVAVGTDATTFAMTSPNAIWNAGPGYGGSGSIINQDWSISLAFRIGEILPGECISKGFAYILDTADLAEALDATTGVQILADSVSISGSVTYCLGDTLRLDVVGDSTADWTWTPPFGLSSDTGQTVFAFPDTTTTYTVSSGALGACGTGIATITIVVDSNYLDITAGEDKSICAGDNVILDGANADIYSWSPSLGLSDPSAATPIAAPSTTRDYILTGETSLGCSLMDTVRVTVNPLPLVFITAPDTVICEGSSLTLTANGAVDYSWSPPTGLNVDTGSIVVCDPTVTTTYFVTGTDANGCSNSDGFEVDVLALAAPNALADPSTIDITLGETATLFTDPDDYITYSWTPSSGLLSDPTGSTVTAQPVDTAVYIVTVTNEFGCVAIDSVQLNVIGDYEVFLPTAFSPNGDGMNDTYMPFILGTALDRFMVNFTIYNRWGEVVFVSNDRFTGWNGRVGGVDQEIGTFVVVVNSIVKGEQRIDRGTFTLVK